MFQSTRPRGARHVLIVDSLGKNAVSIHAPTRGATAHRARRRPLYRVSIHAPTRGATSRAACSMSSRCCFNPRAHAGRDGGSVWFDDDWVVSIHAPTRGATNRLCRRGSGHRFQSTRPRGARHSATPLPPAAPRFNPRAHAGRDRASWRVFLACSAFQSTRPRGARHGLPRPDGLIVGFNPRAHAGRDRPSASACRPSAGFNPRAHAGRDAPICCPASPGVRFQSTRPRGARPGKGLTKADLRGFNPRAHAGRDCISYADEGRVIVSIHAPTRGATDINFELSPQYGFQSTRPRGARLLSGCALHSFSLFQSTRPRGARPPR